MLGIDVGGTFTDFVLHDSGIPRTWTHKRSTGADPAEAVTDGLRELLATAQVEPGEVGLVIHGTTVATNALLEYDGARAGLITTEGFRDVLHIGRHQRPQNYSIQQDIPWQARPLVKRRDRLPVPERIIPPTGEVELPLDVEAVRRAAETLRDNGVKAVAVCFLFAYLNGEHERRAAEIVCETMPDAFVCTSHEVAPQFREFERFTTTAVNAFVGPRVRAYMRSFAERLRGLGIASGLHVMQSNGGTATLEVAERRPATLLLSGPVGGVMGGIWSARELGADRHLATLDVGGTSADIGIVTEDGLVEARQRDTWIAGYPVTTPMIDIETIGAGGGSVAYVDRGGALHVGPRSAGARPGPAAYARGGEEPTLTDANVVLGRLPTELAGGLSLDRTLAAAAIDRLSWTLGTAGAETAAGIVRIVNENMAAALRTKTVQRGLDPRGFLLCAFGGAGPLQAAELAAIVGIPEVVIPPNPGVTSAAGLLTADLRYDLGRSYLMPLAQVDPEPLGALFDRHEAELREQLRDDGCAEEAMTVDRAADLRYNGQGYELKVPLPAGELTRPALEQLASAFHADHEREFGHHFPELEIEFVNLRLTAVGKLPHIVHAAASGTSVAEARIASTQVTFSAPGGGVESRDTDVYRRELLPVGERVAGPAIVVQSDSTTLVPPGWDAVRDAVGNLRLTRSAEETA
jgi:N-methylhydantoinase A/oxoprolinase/acetone carboxylase beta subunit